MKEGRGFGKKVLYVFSSSNYSGAEIVIARLIENNARVEAYVACPHGTFGRLLQEKPGVTVFFFWMH